MWSTVSQVHERYDVVLLVLKILIAHILITHLLKYFSLKHPAKYIGKKPRKYIIPAKPLTPMHLQSLSGNSPNETDSGGGNGRVTSNEQVHMYREMSSGALSRATYNKVGITTLQYHTFTFNISPATANHY